MRIISGSAGSIPLLVPRALTRPTTDRVRESIFAVLGDLVQGARVLDLFAGTGSLGLEALSRGAVSADFVDSSAAACESVAKNLQKTRLCGGVVHRRDALAWLSSAPEGRYDLIFADPPYARDEQEKELLEALLTSPRLAASLSPSGLLVLETLASAPLPETTVWIEREARAYGTTRASFLAPRPQTP